MQCPMLEDVCDRNFASFPRVLSEQVNLKGTYCVVDCENLDLLCSDHVRKVLAIETCPYLAEPCGRMSLRCRHLPDL